MKSTESHPLVSIVILNYNAGTLLLRCLKSVFESTYPNFEVVLVDNASTDGSIECAEREFSCRKNLRIIKNPRNMGFAEGNNIGFKATRGDFVVFLNPDTRVEPSWLNEMVSVLESDPSLGACQCKILLMDDPQRIDSIGGYLDFFGFPYSINSYNEKDEGQYVDIREIFVAKGTCICLKRKVIEEVGLFDPLFFILYEENDLCWRIRLRGYRIVFAPHAVIYHKTGYSASMIDPALPTFFATRNSLITLMKNYDSLNLLRFLPPLILIRISETFLLVLKGKHSLALAKLKALAFILTHFRVIWRKRIRVQRLIRRVSDKCIMKYMRRPDFKILFNQFRRLYLKD